jgi:DNA-binding SARP family transcriptional activator
MEFRILGPVEIRDNAGVRTLAAARQRAVLVALLLQANRTVAVDSLIDQVWGDDPPRTSAVTIRNYIARIRGTLGEPAVRTRPPGYLLVVDRGRVDLYRFQDRVAEGRAQLADRPDRAALTLRRALALWRGPALADLGNAALARYEGPRLAELRMAALEDRFTAELESGQDAALVGDLQALVAQHPMRERLVGLLMLALFRSGRRAEAIDVYRRTHRGLMDDLAVGPGAALRLIHARILDDVATDSRSGFFGGPA